MQSVKFLTSVFSTFCEMLSGPNKVLEQHSYKKLSRSVRELIPFNDDDVDTDKEGCLGVRSRCLSSRLSYSSSFHPTITRSTRRHLPPSSEYSTQSVAASHSPSASRQYAYTPADTSQDTASGVDSWLVGRCLAVKGQSCSLKKIRSSKKRGGKDC